MSYDELEPADALWYVGGQLDAIEHARIAINNQIKQLERDAGLLGSIAYLALIDLRGNLLVQEGEFEKQIRRTVRRHPVYPFIKETVGIGEKQAARLLQVVPDPYWNAAEDRPRRGPAELWAYCGYAPSQKRTRGEKCSWNHIAKMRARLIASSCIKQAHSPYRTVYDAARASWADRETSDLHKHNHALRLVAKAVLRDFYLAAKDVA